MKLNRPKTYQAKTHEGGPAVYHHSAEEQLRRSVMSCMLWEDTFYEGGQSIGDRIDTLATQVKPSVLADMAVEARHDMKLRHVPLLLLSALAKVGSGTSLVSETIAKVISRPDEMT